MFCVQESWLTENQSIKIEDYEYFRSDRHKGKLSKRGHGGVVVFFKKEIKKGLTKIKSKNMDNIWVKLSKKFFGLNNDTYLLCSYIPPAESKFQKDYDIFNNLDIEISSFASRGDIFIIGDLNSRIADTNETYVIDVLDNTVSNIENPIPRTSKDKKINTNGRKLMNIVNSHHLTILNGRTLGDFDGQMTCVEYNGCSVVDYCIVSNSLQKKVNYFKVKDLEYYSDHFTITCSIKCNFYLNNQSKFNGKRIDKYKWSNSDRDNFCMLLNSDEYSEKLKQLNREMAENPQNATQAFDNFVISVAEKTLKKSKRGRKKNNKFEFTEECSNLRANFKKNQRKFKSSKPQDNNLKINMLIAQKKYRREINMQKRIKKENDINSLKKIEKSDPKLFWKSVKNLINNTKFDDSDNISDQDWVDYFHRLYNKQDSNNQNQFSQYITESLKVLEKQQPALNQSHILLNGNITKEEIVTNIKSLKNGKSVGTDMISGEMLKCCIENDRMTESIQILFNNLLNTGTYPTQWNCSLITPIHKSGPTDNPHNYRGIAVSTCISKVYNKILTKRLDKHMSDNKLWSKFQGGFKSKIRTEDNIMILKTIITETSDRT